jgi:hypothetical protein
MNRDFVLISVVLITIKMIENFKYSQVLKLVSYHFIVSFLKRKGHNSALIYLKSKDVNIPHSV